MRPFLLLMMMLFLFFFDFPYFCYFQNRNLSSFLIYLLNNLYNYRTTSDWFTLNQAKCRSKYILQCFQNSILLIDISFISHRFFFTQLAAELILPNSLGSSGIHFAESRIERTCIGCFVACQQPFLYQYYNWF